MGLVEEQEAGAAGQCHGQARPPLLTGREATEGDAGQAGQAELLEDGVGVGDLAAAGPDPEPHVLPDGEVVVGAGGVADQGQLGPDRLAVDGQVMTQDDAGAGGQGQQAGQEPEQGRLAGAVRPCHQHDLALGDVEVDAGQRRILAEEADGGPQMNGGRGQFSSNCRTDSPD